MSDKIRLIYNKIENRIDEICEDGFVSKENQQEYETLTDLEDFIDSFLKGPVNEDLEEEIERCWKEMFPIGWSDYTILTLTYEQHKAFARHFAEWQKQQDEELFSKDSWTYIEENYPDITEEEKLKLYDISIKSRLAGANAVKQLMMKGAVDATIFSELKSSDGSVFQAKSDRFRMDGVKISDRIKITPIKTEQQ